MKIKNFIIPFFLLGLFLNLAFSPCTITAAKMKQEEEKDKAQERIIIPEEVKTALQQGIAQRLGRQDIPFRIIKHLHLPARQNTHSIFLFKIKNVDMGFVPLPSPPDQKKPEEAAEEKKETPPVAQTETPAVQLQTSLNAFLQFHRLEDKEPVEVFKEVYIPINFQADSTSYDPEKEEVYSTAYPLSPGDYLLAMAITSLDLQKIGTLYFEFSLPDTSLFTDKLDTTPIFFVKEFKQMASPETTAEVHKDFFTYAVLQVAPKIESVFSPGEKLDILYYIFGTQPGEDGKFDIGVNYEVLKDEEKIIRFQPITYPNPFVSQPLPMKKTVIIKSEEEGEKKEPKDLEPGAYTLSVKIKDNVSGKSLTKEINFEVK